MTFQRRGARLALATLAVLCLAGPALVRAWGPVLAPRIPRQPAAVAEHEHWFVDITEQTGLHFVHRVGPLGTYYLPEISGAGAALFDYDADGDLDLYCVQSGISPSLEADSSPRGVRSRMPHAFPQGYPNQLFRQEADGTFTDVTEASGLGDAGYGVGVAVGDIDNDGDPDVYITNCGPDQLYQNNNDGTFTNITESAGIDNPGYGTSVALFDYDRDGWLDLFVANYVEDRISGYTFSCADADGRVNYCGPLVFPPSTDLLMRNTGPQACPGGVRSVRFIDVTESTGVSAMQTAGYGVVCGDFDGDAWPDVYVASDMRPNPMWINRGGERFHDEGLASGTSVDRDGQPQASMGVAAGDVDGDGDSDIVVTHLTDQTNTLYVNESGRLFSDRTAEAGLGATTRPHTGWGVGLVDLDLDGDLDMPVANGLVTPRNFEESLHAAAGLETLFHYEAVEDEQAYWREYADANLLLVNDGTGRFADGRALAGDFAAGLDVARALVFGDIDNDGDLDMVVTRCGGPTQLLRNDAPRRGHWLSVRAFAPALHRDAYGAVVTVFAGDRSFRRVVQPAYSYLASNDPRAHFGLGQRAEFDQLTVLWPDGLFETFPGGSADRFLVVRRGTGTAQQARLSVNE